MRGSPKCRALRNMPGLLSSLFSIISPLKPSVLDEPFEDGHLDVETVLRLVEDGGSRPLDHLVRDLLAPVGGEAMHHDPPATRLPQQRRVDAIPLEGGAPLPALGLLPHAGPDVGVEHVRVPRRFRRSADDPDVPPADLSRLLDDRGIRLVPLRARHPQVEPEDVGRLDPRVGHVVPVPDEGHPHLPEILAPLAGGHQVGEDLARMVPVRQPVDHRDGCGGGELHRRFVRERTDHDGVRIPGKDARGVPDRLPAADLRVLRGQEERVTAQPGHRNLERDAGPGRRLLEDHRQRLPRERPDRPPRPPAPLPRRSRTDQGEDLPVGEVEDPQQVLLHDFRPSAGRTAERISSARSISPSVTVRGGRNRRTFPAAALTTSPASRHRAATGFVSHVISTPTMRPSPRTFRMSVLRAAISRSPPWSRSPFRATSSWKPGAHRTSITARAAAQQTGFPPNVLPCVPGTNAAATSSRATTAPSGRPFAIPFASVTTSGAMPNRPEERNAPVRPIPVWISSATRRIPFFRQSASASLR